MDYKFAEYIKRKESDFLKRKVNGNDLIRISDANTYFNSYIKQLSLNDVVVNEAENKEVDWSELENSGLDTKLRKWNDSSEVEFVCPNGCGQNGDAGSCHTCIGK